MWLKVCMWTNMMSSWVSSTVLLVTVSSTALLVTASSTALLIGSIALFVVVYSIVLLIEASSSPSRWLHVRMSRSLVGREGGFEYLLSS